MQYEQNKRKLEKIWNRTNKSKRDLELKSEYLSEILSKTNTFNYVIKKVITIETEWELMENGYYQEKQKLHRISINNFPLRLLPFIKVTVLCKLTNESQVINQSGVGGYYIHVLGLEEYEEVHKVNKSINIYVEHIIFNYPFNDQYLSVHSKVILTIIDPRIYK